jgi:membrane protease YdiL (CAAX protease family)
MSAPQGQPGAPTSLSQGYYLPTGQFIHYPSESLQTDPRQGPPWTLRYSWRDTLAILVYIGCMLLGLPVLLVAAWLAMTGKPFNLEDPNTQALAQSVTYGVLLAAFLLILWPDFKRAAATFRDRPGLKWGMVPVAFIANLAALSLFSLLVQALMGGVDVSANQKGLEEMAQSASFPLMALGAVVCAPIAEEYIFRNLLIGKLSRKVNQWVCLVLSAAAFALLHALAGWPENPLTLLPYFIMGISFGLIYIFSGKSFVYSSLIHALHNFMALGLLYVAPNLPV